MTVPTCGPRESSVLRAVGRRLLSLKFGGEIRHCRALLLLPAATRPNPPTLPFTPVAPFHRSLFSLAMKVRATLVDRRPATHAGAQLTRAATSTSSSRRVLTTTRLTFFARAPARAPRNVARLSPSPPSNTLALARHRHRSALVVFAYDASVPAVLPGSRLLFSLAVRRAAHLSPGRLPEKRVGSPWS